MNYDETNQSENSLFNDPSLGESRAQSDAKRAIVNIGITRPWHMHSWPFG